MAELTDAELREVRRIIDEDGIRRLQYSYSRLMDDGFCSGELDADALAALWTEDGTWEGGAYGRYVGRAAIAEYFRHHALEVPFANHYITNEEFAVDGEGATCRSLLLVPATFIVDGEHRDDWMFVAFHNSFAKVNGRWLFTKLQAHVFKQGPHLTGVLKDLKGA